MSITDELREWKGHIQTRLAPEAVLALRGELNAIADRIDEEHEKQVTDAFTRGVIDGIDMAEHSIEYAKLPVDADGELIRTGDMMQIKDCDGRWCGPFKVLYQVFTGAEWRIVLDAGTYAPKECRHYHAPTVEDVLREFGDRYARTKGGCDEDGIIAEYAAKLRLSGEDA